jgi:hypothetical protein
LFVFLEKSTGVQDGFGVATRLFASHGDEVSRSTHRVTVEIRRECGVGRVIRVLLVDDSRHAHQGCFDLISGDDSMANPVGQLL